jgi:predicted aspartyl protease
MPRLEFSHRRSYAPGAEGISLPVVLSNAGESVHVLASVDTGASNCLFEREHAELLNLEIEAGYPKTFWTATGPVETFGHTVELNVLGLKVESMVYFFADEHIGRNLLGRTGWLDRVRFGLVEHDLELYLAVYDFEPA